MKKGIGLVFVFVFLMALLCGAAAAESESIQAKGETSRYNFVSAPLLCGPSDVNIAVSNDGRYIRLSWTPDSGRFIQGYQVYRCDRLTTEPNSEIWFKDSKGYYWVPIKKLVETSQNSFEFFLPKLCAYNFLVISFGRVDGVLSLSSSVACSVYNAAYVEPPQVINIKQEDQSSVKLTWSAGEGAKSYAIYRAEGKEDFKKIATEKGLEYTDKKLKSGTAYRYKIQATNGTRTKDSKVIRVTLLDKPASVKAECDKKGYITITWNKVKGAKNYRVYQLEPGSKGYTYVTTVKENKVKLKAAFGDGTYKFFVAGADGSFRGAKSDNVSVKVNAPKEKIKYRALLVNNTYVGSGINTLLGTPNNAKAMAGALKGMSQDWKVKRIQNVEAKDILAAIQSTFEGTDANDVCLFYYSGHGSTSYDENSGALVGHSGKTFVKMEDLANALDAACQGKVIVLMDSCGGGAGIDKGMGASDLCRTAVDAFSARDKEVIDKNGELCGSKFNVLVAASRYTISFEIEPKNGSKYAAFTYGLLTSLGASYPDGAYSGSTMPADKDGDHALSLIEAYNGICEGVKKLDVCDGFDQVTQYYGEKNTILFERKK